MRFAFIFLLCIADATEVAEVVEKLSFSMGTNGGSNKFSFEPTKKPFQCQFFISGSDISGTKSFAMDQQGKPWTEYVKFVAADVFGGTIVNGGGTIGIDSRCSSNTKPKVSNPSSTTLKFGPDGVGGQLRFEYASESHAMNAKDFFTNFFDLVFGGAISDKTLGDIYNQNCGTSFQGDAVDVFETSLGKVELSISKDCATCGPCFKLNDMKNAHVSYYADVKDWFVSAIEKLGATTKKNGNFSGKSEPNIRTSNGMQCKLSGKGVGGSFVWEFPTEADAEECEALLDFIADYDLFTTKCGDVSYNTRCIECGSDVCAAP